MVAERPQLPSGWRHAGCGGQESGSLPGFPSLTATPRVTESMQMSEHAPPDQSGSGFADEHVATLLRHISEKYPALVVRSARVEPAGQRCSTLVINDTIVFRFPRTQAEVDALGIEASILRAIRDNRPLPTPDLA
jgi:hypothetical protein